MGLRNWLFGTDEKARVAETPDEDPRDEDDEPEKERPYPVETEKFSTLIEPTAEGRFARTVELVSAVNGQNILIEFDTKERSGSTMRYRAFNDGTPDARWPGGVSIEPSFRTDLIELNESNILSRKTLGSYNVSLEQDVHVVINGVTIVDPIDSIPSECRRPGGSPHIRDSMHRYDDDKNYVVAEDGPALSSYGMGRSGFHHIETDDGHELVYVQDCRVKKEVGDMVLDPNGSTPDVIANSIETGTDVMRAVLSDGTVVMPDDEQGLTDEGSDMMRIAELASDRQA